MRNLGGDGTPLHVGGSGGHGPATRDGIPQHSLCSAVSVCRARGLRANGGHWTHVRGLALTLSPGRTAPHHRGAWGEEHTGSPCAIPASNTLQLLQSKKLQKRKDCQYQELSRMERNSIVHYWFWCEVTQPLGKTFCQFVTPNMYLS